MYEWIIENKELFKVFYAIAIGLISAFIVLKTHRLFSLSHHQGIRYFRNAFLFYGIAFIIRFFVGSPFIYDLMSREVFSLINFIFEFFLIMAGFFLLYSLLWKKIEGENNDYSSSLFNLKIFPFYIMALILAVLDFLWSTREFMFFSQIFAFAIAVVISYNNYKKKGTKHRFLKFYFVAMILGFLAWVANSVAALYLNWNRVVLMGIYSSNLILFLLFLYGVVIVTQNGKKTRKVGHN